MSDQMITADCDCRSGSPYLRGLFKRRQILRAGGAGFVAALTTLLVGAGHSAEAEPVAARVPKVDRLSVQIIVDNYTDRYSVPAHPDGMKLERAGGTEKPGVPPRETLRAEWGLSMLAESKRGAESRRVMVDFGYSPEVLLTNLRFLGIEPAGIDALILSHGHVDHFGGLLGFLADSRGHLKPGLPLFVGGEDCFCSRQGPNAGDYGVLDRPGILAAGIKLMLAEGPAIAADHAVTSGQIPKKSYENPVRGTTERTGIVGGLGCDPAAEPSAKNTGVFVLDDYQHEIATSYVVEGKGLVVLTSCSHRGVINSIRQAQASSGVEKLHALVGGFHLVPSLSDDYVRQTVAELTALKPDFVVPAHCAGERFYDMARAEMPGRVVRSAVGTKVTFGAA